MASRAQTWPVWLASQESWVRWAGREPPQGRGRGHTLAPSGHRQPCSPPGPRPTSSGAGGRPRDPALGNAVLQRWVPVGQVGAGCAHLCRPHGSHVHSHPPFPEPWHLRGRILQDAGLLKTTSGSQQETWILLCLLSRCLGACARGGLGAASPPLAPGTGQGRRGLRVSHPVVL